MSRFRSVILVLACAAGLVGLGFTFMPGPAPTAAPYRFDVRGVSLAHLHRGGMGYGSDECREQLAALREIGVNWIAINDFAYMEAVDKPTVRFGGDRTMRDRDLARTIEDAHAAGLQVLVKPHVWSREFGNNGKWHGDIRMNSEADWDEWFSQYGAYVLRNAEIAEQTKAEAFCVGLEYVGAADQEKRWRKLVADVRKVYSGKLTYAAHFSEYRQIQWWDALDCVGINAYWPVTDKAGAGEAELRAGWRKVYAELEPFARRVGKPICFTELGYTASASAGKEPWASRIVDRDEAYQATLYRVAIEEMKKRDYVCGVFLWKWFTADQSHRREGGDPFALQNRGAVIEVMKSAFRP